MNRKLKDLRSAQGFTFIEVIIAISLFAAVVGVAYYLQSFGIVSFTQGENRVSTQQDIRLVTRLMCDEIRYLKPLDYEIKIRNTLPTSFGPNDIAFYVKQGNGNIVKKVGNSEEFITNNSGDEDGYELTFERVENDSGDDNSNTIIMTVKGGFGCSKFDVATELKPLNDGVKIEGTTGSILHLIKL